MKTIPGILYKGTGLFLAYMIMAITGFAQEQAVDVDVNTNALLGWLERNWIWVVLGVVLLLIFLSAGKRRTTTRTTTTYRRDDGTVTKSTTVESD